MKKYLIPVIASAATVAVVLTVVLCVAGKAKRSKLKEIEE